jgi:hypothetical protein
MREQQSVRPAATGRVAIVVVLSSLTSAVTVVLARFLDRSFMAWHQWLRANSDVPNAVRSIMAAIVIERARGARVNPVPRSQ